jgi:hypothetical protein
MSPAVSIDVPNQFSYWHNSATRACWELQAKYKWVVSGTPLSNSVMGKLLLMTWTWYFLTIVRILSLPEVHWQPFCLQSEDILWPVCEISKSGSDTSKPSSSHNSIRKIQSRTSRRWQAWSCTDGKSHALIVINYHNFVQKAGWHVSEGKIGESSDGP